MQKSRLGAGACFWFMFVVIEVVGKIYKFMFMSSSVQSTNKAYFSFSSSLSYRLAAPVVSIWFVSV